MLDVAGFPTVVAEFNGSGMRTASYHNGAGLEADIRNGQTRYFDFDDIGSTAALTGSSGSNLNRYVYAPFGDKLYSQETSANQFQFVGQFGLTVEAFGSVFMRARYYRANAGRFISAEPVIVQAEEFNSYRYVANNPISLIDVDGYAKKSHKKVINYETQIKSNSTNKTIKKTSKKNVLTVINLPPGNYTSGYNPHIKKGSKVIAKPKQSPSADFHISLAGPPPHDPAEQLNLPSLEYSDESQSSGDIGIEPKPISVVKIPNPLLLSPKSGGSGGSFGAGGVAGSQDPNEKRTTGFGPLGFIDSRALIPYSIHFENLGPGSVPTPTQPATAPAQRVEITDQLSTNLDWTTMRFTEIAFGDTVQTITGNGQYSFTTIPITFNGRFFNVEVELSFDPATGLIRAIFQSIDSGTGLPPDVLTGFLPPEDGTGRGKAYLNYSVQTKAGLANQTQIRNVALIRFDGQTVVATNQIDPQNPAAGTDPNKEALNTIDSELPTGTVLPLPATTNTGPFQVSWAGMDDMSGSGVGTFDVYVSDNNGPFVLWLSNTPNTSDVYAGLNGHTYGFYVVAIDHVGNRAVAPIMAQATTIIDIQPPKVQQFTVNDGSSQRSRVTSFTIQFNTVVTLPTNASSAFTLTGPTGPIAISVDTTSSTPLQTNAKLTFSGASTDFGSLADGNYDLTILASQVHDLFGNALDGDGNGTSGDNYATATTGATRLYRLFGDSNGDRTVNSTDFAAFRTFFGLGASIFDFNNDSQTNSNDFAEFRKRFGLTLGP